MNVPVLLDTNVLVYAEDSSEPRKRDRAQAVITRLAQNGTPLVTTQILGEYYYTVSRLFQTSLGDEAARARVEQYGQLFGVLPMTFATVIEAVRGTIRYRIHYYDAQIWASARLNGVEVVLSEDFDDGREIEGVRFSDPFVEGFDIRQVLGGA